MQASLGKWATKSNPVTQAIGSWARQVEASRPQREILESRANYHSLSKIPSVAKALFGGKGMLACNMCMIQVKGEASIVALIAVCWPSSCYVECSNLSWSLETHFHVEQLLNNEHVQT